MRHRGPKKPAPLATKPFALAKGPESKQHSTAPMWSVGQKLELEVEQLTPEGRGLARDDYGRPVFIEGALPGEQVRAQMTSVHAKYSEAIVDELRSISPERIEPRCQHYSRCGGCATQHISAGQAVSMKQPALAEQLKRMGNVVPKQWLPTLHREPWHYRRTAHLALRWQDESHELALGFRERGGQGVVDVQECPVLETRLEALISPLRELLKRYPEQKDLGHVELEAGDNGIAIKLRLVKDANEDWLASAIDWAHERDVQLWLQMSADGAAKCVTDAPKEGGLVYTLPHQNVRFVFTPDDFIQVNAGMNEAMVDLAMELLAPKAGERVLDLFAGLGNFSLAAARAGAQVVAVEGTRSMVDRGNDNAREQGFEAVEFCKADLSQDFSHHAWARQGFDKVILDPPRAGALHTIAHIAALKPKRIVYISCNPATLARDAAALAKAGYHLLKAGAMDMFPQTAHLEAIAVFEPAPKARAQAGKRGIWR
ncbi:23S rRNA (uracil(1939)-C(5))-methyltransferase RlmD [Pokkaliibacter sp. CJK22405]|uniref:23S rRNA (uracil(1939)-C(5))-methyltransferase RlmD n=1 Tax=Pokkaliibacter sp. CJK22405 TaxID=3384615 RepID=UPI0039849902